VGKKKELRRRKEKPGTLFNVEDSLPKRASISLFPW
jgi:hypothetical protein